MRGRRRRGGGEKRGGDGRVQVGGESSPTFHQRSGWRDRTTRDLNEFRSQKFTAFSFPPIIFHLDRSSSSLVKFDWFLSITSGWSGDRPNGVASRMEKLVWNRNHNFSSDYIHSVRILLYPRPPPGSPRVPHHQRQI